MDGGTGVAIVLFTLLGLIFCGIVGCCGFCCLCCAFPIFSIISGMFKTTSSNSSRARGGEYEMVNDASYHQTVEGYEPSAPPLYANLEPMAEAYIVPPLVEAHALQAEAVALERGGAPISQTYQTAFRDVWAALLFLLNVGVVLLLAVRGTYLAHAAPQQMDLDLGVLKLGLLMFLTLAFTASCAGSLGLSFLMKHSQSMIEYMLWANIIMQAVGAVMCLFALQVVGFVIFAVLAALNYWYLRSVADRIPFASSVLTTACAALQANYAGFLSTAYCALFVQLAWVGLWGMAMWYVRQCADDSNNNGNSGNGDGNGNSEDDSGINGFVLFLLLVSLYWGVQVIRSVVDTTIEGTVACWWFQPKRPSPVRGSLFRALSTSFGSICLGSLIVALLQAARAMVHGMKRQLMRGRNRDGAALPAMAGACLLGMLEFLLEMLEYAVRYFNKYAYCYVAAYGLGFVDAGQKVTELFTKRGWTAIINDNLISRALGFGVLALAVFNALMGVVLGLIVAANGGDVGLYVVLGAVLGALTGLVAGMVLSQALDSAVAMVYVCFAEDPAALQTNHPSEYSSLKGTWDHMHPGSLSWHTSSAMGSGGRAPATGGVGYVGGSGGGGGVGIVYPTANNVYTQPAHLPTYLSPPSPHMGVYGGYDHSGGAGGGGAYGYGEDTYAGGYAGPPGSNAGIATRPYAYSTSSMPAAKPVDFVPVPSAPPAQKPTG
ncbi:plasma-membrane choline transporter-domain-containing protein [Ochromonadaceae sp. CCMP2298]|nr:plasma-membrane choline transporter-domain-containing protein [Ochromonadaceae sp. CCMP2298]